MKTRSKHFLSLFLPVTVLVMFWKGLFIYFAQDDFWLLSISQAKSIKDFLLFFIPLKDAVWYRPLSSQIFFYFGRLLFNLNPFPYHLVVIITHMITSFALFKLVKSVVSKKGIAELSAFLYATHQLHTVSLSWLAAYSFVIGPLFLCLILQSFVKKQYGRTFIFLLLGSLTNEILLLSPLLLLGILLSDSFSHILIYRKNYRAVQWVVGYFGISALVIFLRFFAFPSQQSTQLYSISISPDIVGIGRFYLLRLLGFPLFFQQLPIHLKLLSIALVSSMGFILLWGLWLKKHQITKLIRKNSVWKIVFFGCMFPFLMLTNHISPHYLSFALVGLAPLIAGLVYQVITLFSSPKRNLIKVLLLFNYITLQYLGIQWTYQNHWIYQRARLAKQLVEANRFIHPVGSDEYFALGANSAAKIFNQTPETQQSR